MSNRIYRLSDNEIALMNRQIEDSREIDKLRAELEDVRQQRETLKRDYEEIHELWRLVSFECKDLTAEVKRRGEMLRKARPSIQITKLLANQMRSEGTKAILTGIQSSYTREQKEQLFHEYALNMLLSEIESLED